MGHICIIGGGIIGTATAYYLSQLSEDSITIIESSERLFASASGFAGGFLAKDWFAPSVASLGALSFDLHRALAGENKGRQKWGYSSSTALGLANDEGVGAGKDQRDEDWLRQGTSRSTVASTDNDPTDVLRDDGSPAWLVKQKDRSVEVIGGTGTAAQVDPLRLCEFLLDSAVKWNVKVMTSTKPTAVTVSNGILGGLELKQSDKMVDVPCTKLIITAGAWTPDVFATLFPQSRRKIPITPLAGHSIVLKSPRHTPTQEEGYGGTHAIFCGPTSRTPWAPELLSRTGGEIYFTGLNDAAKPLPVLATDSKDLVEEDSIAELKSVAVQMMGLAKDGNEPRDDLEVTREAVCFRPVAASGAPIISKIADDELGSNIKQSADGGVFIAAGHGLWGISLGPGTGKVLAEMVVGQATSADVKGLAL